MNWLIIVLSLVPACITATIIFANAKHYNLRVIGCCGVAVLVCCMAGVGIPLGIVKQNIHDKHEWYIETRLKYAEAEGLEKERLRLDDVMTYNLWYEKNKADLENPWNFKSAAGCEFDYIKIGD
jgi:hypothetical protein